jgi:hypothetical protein
MYNIIRDGERLGMTEAPTYIKQAENGCYILCPEHDASGIAFAGTPYHLLGREGMEDVETVMLEATDVGTELGITNSAVNDADSIIVDQEYRLTLLELGVLGETA